MNTPLSWPGLDLNASAIAFGTVRAGRTWFNRDADAMLGTYLEEGGNVIDTARVYISPEPGCGERIIGNWLHRTGRRQEVILMTKGGHPPLEDMHRSRLAAADMRSDLEASLSALRTDWVDVYFYHRDDPSIPVSELLETMEQFVREGKIRHYGCSNWTLPRMQAAETYARAHGLQGFIGNQALYNIGTAAMHAPADDTLVVADDDMLRHHAGSTCLLMPYCSLCNGYFHRFAADPAQVQGNKYDTPANHRIFAHLRALCDRYGCTMTQSVLGYLLTRPIPMLPLCGASRPEQIRDMMGTLRLPLTANDYQEV